MLYRSVASCDTSTRISRSQVAVLHQLGDTGQVEQFLLGASRDLPQHAILDVTGQSNLDNGYGGGGGYLLDDRALVDFLRQVAYPGNGVTHVGLELFPVTMITIELQVNDGDVFHRERNHFVDAIDLLQFLLDAVG